MKKNQRLMLWIIFFLMFISFVIDLPGNYHLKIGFGKIHIDRIIERPDLSIKLGPLKFQRNLSTRYGLDLSGGTHVLLEADMKNIPDEDKDKAFAASKNVVEKRINLYGLTEPIIQQSKVGDSYRIIAEIPGVSDVDQAVELIGQTAQLTFRKEGTSSAIEATPSSYLDIWPVLTGLNGKNLRRSEVAFNPQTGKPEVSLEFNEEGSELFKEITGSSIGKTVAIFLDNQLVSAPRVNEEITGGRAVIQGDFSIEEAKRLSISLNAGALPVPLKVIQQRNIGATLGSDSIGKSIIAGAIGLSIVAVFMIVNYGFLGIVADFALLIYTLIVFALFKIIPVTLTLAGIAGFILSIGMAVDANILIFERMKEEIRWGKDVVTALSLGFERAFPSIRDSNISSLITCSILYWFGTGTIRGFALTLAVGILVSLFSAITVTRTLVKFIYDR